MLETEIRRLKLADLRLLDQKKNARYMTAPQFGRLVENLRRDGVLTSAPLVYRGVVLSGNHRVQAAIKAGIEEADCINILTELAEPEQLALQLSHNAVEGQDDLSTLQALYASITDLGLKAYSGLTDDSFNVDPIDLPSLSAGAIRYEEVTALFLPEERVAFEDALSRIGKHPKAQVYAASLADFNATFDALVKAKGQLVIHNTAIAMRALADLALKQLNQMADQDQQPQQPTQEPPG